MSSLALKLEKLEEEMNKIKEFETSLNFAHHIIEILKNENRDIKKQMLTTIKSNDELQNQLKTLISTDEGQEERLDYLSDQSRRNNLIITDLPEDAHETWENQKLSF